MTTPGEAPGSVVIIGAGQGGIQTAASLRDNDFRGAITVVDIDSESPYQRPPLSKGYLIGGQRSLVDLRPNEFFVQHDIDLRVGVRATGIDRQSQRVHMEDGDSIEFHHLVLATGASPRRLRVPGGNLPAVHTLRTLADATTLRERLNGSPSRVLVVGGGFLGLEVAGVAVQLGHEVTVVEMQDQVLARVASPALASFVSTAHMAQGTKIILGRSVTEICGQAGVVVGAVLDDGTEIPADVVIVSIGVVPETGLGSSAELEVSDGYVVDGHLRSVTSPHFSAIGDCARFPSTHAGAPARIESVQNAVDQARHIGGLISGCHEDPYGSVPWFWSNQLDLRMQLVGISAPEDTCVSRGDVESARFSVFRFREDRLQSIESVNRPADHIGGRKLFGHGLRPTLQELERNEFKLSPELYR